jgi:sulfoxide reductase heme-binding subunit YedZ
VIVTSLLRERIGHRVWRAVHWASYVSWPLAIEHTLTAGSDSWSVWLLAVQGASILAVSGALVYRLTAGGTNRSRLAAVTGGTADPVAVDPAWRNQ